MDNGQLKKGYKQTEVGVIPVEWDCVSLGDLAVKVGSGITPTGGERVYKDEGRPFLRSQNIGWGKLLTDDIAFIDEKTHGTFINTEIQADDVFLNITGASIGRSAVADQSVKGGNVNQHVCIIRTDKSALNPYFLNHFLSSKTGQRQIDSFQAGGNRQGLNFGQIKQFLIPVTTTTEQRAIATALSDVDALSAALDKLIAKKRAIKTAAMQQLLTGKKRLPGFTGEWDTKPLGSIGLFKKGRNLPKKEIKQNGVPCVLYGEIYTKYNLITSALYSFVPEHIAAQATWISKGDILFAGSGETFEDIGKCFAYLGEERACAGGDVIIFTPHEADSQFLGYLLNSPEVNKQKSSLGQGSSVIHIYRSSLETLTLQMPSLPEQRAIATILSDIDAEITALESRCNKTQAIKQGMMQELLTGRTRLI
ncbi:MAG: restriction endonuclease subunit S [Pseudomonadota bacterium]